MRVRLMLYRAMRTPRAARVAALAALLVAGSLAAPALAQLDPFSGTFASEELTISFHGDSQSYRGQATYQGQTFPLEARTNGSRLYVLRRVDGAGGQAAATSDQDQQVARLLTSSAWCAFRYSQITGASSSERVQFFPDGTVAQGSNSETYSSGRYGTVAGQHGGGQRGRWRIQNGMLMLTADGVNWESQALRITQNSNGYPIVTASGKEYSQCR